MVSLPHLILNHQFNIQEFREEIESTSEKVASAVKSGLLQASKLAGLKRKESEQQGTSGTAKKKTRTFGLLEDDFSDSDSDSDEDVEEQIPTSILPKKTCKKNE